MNACVELKNANLKFYSMSCLLSVGYTAKNLISFLGRCHRMAWAVVIPLHIPHVTEIGSQHVGLPSVIDFE